MTRPVLLDVTVREQAAGEVGPGEQCPDRDPGLLNEFDPHPDLLALLRGDLLKSCFLLGARPPGEGGTKPTTS